MQVIDYFDYAIITLLFAKASFINFKQTNHKPHILPNANKN